MGYSINLKLPEMLQVSVPDATVLRNLVVDYRTLCPLMFVSDIINPFEMEEGSIVARTGAFILNDNYVDFAVGKGEVDRREFYTIPVIRVENLDDVQSESFRLYLETGRRRHLMKSGDDLNLVDLKIHGLGRYEVNLSSFYFCSMEEVLASLGSRADEFRKGAEAMIKSSGLR